MPRISHSSDTSERLVTAGLELFLRQGYNATGVQQLTDRAGVPKGSFYNYFESKEVFAAAVVDHYATWLRRSWERMLSTAPNGPMATIRHVFSRMLAHHERSPRLGCLVGNFAAEVAAASDVCREGLMTAQLAWRERLAGLIVAGQAAGEIRDDIEADALSALTWSMWEGALLRMKVEGSVRPPRESVELMFDKVYPPAAPKAPRPRNTKNRTKSNRSIGSS